MNNIDELALRVAHEYDPTGTYLPYKSAIKEFANALLAELSKDAEPVWQSIETAPRDNKRTLYLARFDDSGILRELDFDGVWEYWQESYEMPHINGYAWCSASGIEEPTHWAFQDLPLPVIRPANAAEIEQRTAEACANFICLFDATNPLLLAEKIRSGKWKEYL